MSGIDNRFIRQYEQAAANMLFQFVEIATGEVGTPDASLKEYIAGEHTVVFGGIINQAAR